jgi:hypothetical protein
VTPTLKIGPGKGITIELPLASETPFSFFVPVYDQGRKSNALNGLGIIDKALGITGSDIELDQIRLGDGDQSRVVFVEDFHTM